MMRCARVFEKGIGKPLCHGPGRSGAMSGESDLDVLIQTGITNPIAITLAQSLLEEARIPFFTMDQNVAARQESGDFLGWWSLRVPREREAEAREILRSVEESK
jgi:predicted TIM-barrel fold metal-dependent hydrolase